MIITNFNQRLGETISWCLSQEIIGELSEDKSIVHRRMMNRQGDELVGKAYRMLLTYERAGWILRWLASKKISQESETLREGEKLMATTHVGCIVSLLLHQLRRVV